MTNAKKEIIEHVADREVEFVSVYNGDMEDFNKNKLIKGTYEEVLPQLDFDYDRGYGRQELYGFVWYKDGTWSERDEYDGSEWWVHRERPDFDVMENGGK